MPASDYVDTYLATWSWVNDTFMPARVMNYLQSGLGAQATRAASAHARLSTALGRLVGASSLPAVFTVQGYDYLRSSLWRVYNGKGAPDEIQDALWLASQCGLVDESSLALYVSNNLGIDCGGFVANYWGLGKPTMANRNPTGATGFKPRTIWGMAPELRRADPATVQVDDAAVFFSGVLNDNPNQAAVLGSDGNYIDGSGSKAFHIGLVSAISGPSSGGTYSLEISESSGGPAASGGNGVNVRQLGGARGAAMTVAQRLVYCMDGPNRVYFIGSRSRVSPYMPNAYA
jgi:hypothetical protein